MVHILLHDLVAALLSETAKLQTLSLWMLIDSGNAQI
jgi:hypothetical protein